MTPVWIVTGDRTDYYGDRFGELLLGQVQAEDAGEAIEKVKDDLSDYHVSESNAMQTAKVACLEICEEFNAYKIGGKEQVPL